MIIKEGNTELAIEVSPMTTDKRLSYWNSSLKQYVKCEHSVFPTTHHLSAIIGKCGSGKSTSLVSLLTSSGKKSRVWRGCYDSILFICNPTSMASFKNSPFGELDESQLFSDFSEETLQAVMEIVKLNKEEDKDTILIIDDAVDKTRQFSGMFTQMCLTHRHFSLSIIILIQDIRFLSPPILNNLSGILIFKNHKADREKLIHEEWLSFLSKKEFALFSAQVWQNKCDSLYINPTDPMKLYRNFKLLDISDYESQI